MKTNNNFLELSKSYLDEGEVIREPEKARQLKKAVDAYIHKFENKYEGFKIFTKAPPQQPRGTLSPLSRFRGPGQSEQS